MKSKRIIKNLLFPHISVLIILLPISTVFLAYSMSFLEADSAFSVVSYILAFYTLSILCLRISKIISFFKAFKNKNKLAKRWFEEESFRIYSSLYGSLIWNTAYSVFQFGLGFYHSSFWFFSLGAYYHTLAIMRFFLLIHSKKHKGESKILKELLSFRICGIIFLMMNIFLSAIIFFMIYWNRTFNHSEITTIAMAAYTFATLTFSIIGAIRYRKMESPIYSAAKAISLASACVSILTLESTMLSTFGGETTSPIFKRIMLGATGGVISLFIVGMAVYMIVKSNKEIKKYKRNKYGK